MNNPYTQYQNNSILTASPQKLTLMLYNGAIKFCNQSMEALEKKDMNKCHYYNLRAQDIIVELQATLDEKYEIAKDFDALYTFILELLVDGNIEKSKEKIEQAKELIIEFRDLWETLMTGGK